jgi:hypothetical protein
MPRPAEAGRTPSHDARVKSGITAVSAQLLCILAAVHGDDLSPRLDVPRGFAASVYASGIDGARDLDVRADGTLTLRSGDDRFEIAPPTADAPVTVMRVAAELDSAPAAHDAAIAVQAPRFVRMRWDAASGELAYALTRADGAGIPVSPQTLTLARVLAHRHDADVAMAPDGSLFVADSRAGAVWRVRRTAL